MNDEELETAFFRFLNSDIPINEFEQWLYATPEVERYLGEKAYFELISFDFHQTAAGYEFAKLVSGYKNFEKFHTWQMKQWLTGLLDGTRDAVEIFKVLYDKYCYGYGFLDSIGLQYVLGIDEIPTLKQKELWDEKEFNKRRELLTTYITPLKSEIAMLIEGLESGDLKIIDEQNYSIDPDFAQRLSDLRRAKTDY